MVELQSSKLAMRVRFPSPAPFFKTSNIIKLFMIYRPLLKVKVLTNVLTALPVSRVFDSVESSNASQVFLDSRSPQKEFLTRITMG